MTAEEFRKRLDSTNDIELRLPLFHEYLQRVRLLDLPETERVSKQMEQEAVAASNEKYRGLALRYLGVVDDNRGDYASAIRKFEEARRIFQEQKMASEVIGVNNLLGKVFANIGDYSRAIDVFEESLRLARELKDESGESNTLNAFSVIYQRSGNAEKAAELAQRSMDLAKKLGNKRLQAVSALNLGNAYGLNHFWSLAIKTWEDALRLFEELQEPPLVGSALGNLGIAYLRMGKLEQAEENIRKCLEIKKGHNDVYDLARSYHNLGTVLWKKGQINEAKDLYSLALSMGESARARSIHVEIYKDLIELFRETGDFKSALESFDQFHKLSGELFSENMNLKTRALQVRFEVEKMEKENEIYRLRNIDLASANEEIEKKNSDITASIRYAQRIQEALLPEESALKKGFSDVFILYHPRDIVSGDFYWSLISDDAVFFAVADCTGHGVPGALMSVMGAAFLSEIINERGVKDPAEALNLLRLKVITALHGQHAEIHENAEEQLRDGMDIVLCRFEPTTMQLQFAGANNPLWILREGKMMEFEGDNFPVGLHHGAMKYFTSGSVELKAGDELFLFTDGFADQFGGPKEKKFGYKQMRELFTSIHHYPMSIQKQKIEEVMNAWRGKNEQVDDVLVFGLRL